MKKGIIVLLITVLAAGLAFADLHGSAGIELGFNLDSKDWGFANPNGVSQYKFSFTVDSQKVSIGAEHSTDVWAELEASGSATISYDSSKKTDTPVVAVSASVSKANIHIGEDWTIGILNAGGAYDYVKHPFVKDSKNKPLDAVSFDGKAAPGFTVKYKEWNGGFGAAGNTDTEKYTIFAHIQTPSFKFAEDAVSVQAAGYAKLADSDKLVGAALKASYKKDKLNAGVAADLQYKSGKVFLYEAAAYAGYDFVTLNVYSTFGQLLSIGTYKDKEVKLDAKLAAEYTFEGDVPVTVSAYAQITDAIIDSREIAVGADASATVDAFEFGVGASYAIMAKTLDLYLSASYTQEKFTVYALVGTDDANFAFNFGADPALQALGVELGVTSTAIVENAELALKYHGANFVKAGDSVAALGAITASATISF